MRGGVVATRSPASLTCRRRTATRERQTRRLRAQRPELRVFPRRSITITFVSGDTLCSLACTCSPLVSGIHTSSTARGTAWLASVHKDLRLCDLCKELAFGHQCVNGSSRDSYNSLEFNVLWRQFLESSSMMPATSCPGTRGY